MKKHLAILILFCLSFLLPTSYADLTPQLIQASTQAIGVGFIPFDKPASSIVEKDLRNSGRVNLIVSPTQQEINDPNQIQTKTWQTQHVRYLLFGALQNNSINFYL